VAAATVHSVHSVKIFLSVIQVAAATALSVHSVKIFLSVMQVAAATALSILAVKLFLSAMQVAVVTVHSVMCAQYANHRNVLSALTKQLIVKTVQRLVQLVQAPRHFVPVNHRELL
jgi:hypothetical protein